MQAQQIGYFCCSTTPPAVLKANIQFSGFRLRNPQVLRALAFVQKYRNAAFVLLLLGMSLVYGVHKVLPHPPLSVHQWRQADCASAADMYYQGGMHFFEPKVHNQFVGEGEAAGELPLLPYLAATGYHLVGHNYWVYRGLVYLCFLIGLFALFKAFELLLNSAFWGAWLSLLMSSSPLLLYYGSSFLANVPALSFAFVAIYFLARFRKTHDMRWLWLMAAACTLAAWLKITAGITLAAVGALWLVELIFPIRFGIGRKLFGRPWLSLLPLVVAVGAILSWYLWAAAYNRAHFVHYFSNWTYPIWTLEGERISSIYKAITEYWWRFYFKPTTLHAGIVLMSLVLLFYRKQNAFFPGMAFFTVVGAAVYVTMQFDTFHDHDYYTINLMVMMVWAIGGFFAFLAQHYPRWLGSSIFKVLLLVFLVANVLHGREKYQARYEGHHLENRLWHLENLAPELVSIGIGEEDRVICIPDGSGCITLQALNKKGWTGFGTGTEDRVISHIENGAKWLIVHDSLPEEYAHFEPFMQNLHSQHGQVSIYRLPEL